jgi:hypothetical protein
MATLNNQRLYIYIYIYLYIHMYIIIYIYIQLQYTHAINVQKTMGVEAHQHVVKQQIKC